MWSPGLDSQAGRGEAAGDRVGPGLDLLQLAFDDADQVGVAGDGEVDHGAFEPDQIRPLIFSTAAGCKD